jgi:hypothetical protein
MKELDKFGIEWCHILIEEMLGTIAKTWEMAKKEGIKREIC